MYFKVNTVKQGDCVYRYLRLMQAFREDGKVRQRVVASLGSLDSLGAKRLAELGNYLSELGREGASPIGQRDLEGSTPITPACAGPGAGSAKIAASLKKWRIFSDLDQQQCGRLSQSMMERHVKRGNFVFIEGEVLEHFYVVTEGRVKILRHSASGKDFIMAFSGPGDIVGNVAFLSGKAHPSSAQAVTDTTLLVIRNDDFLKVLAGDPDLGFKIFRQMLVVVGLRSARAMRRLTDLSAQVADHRLAHVVYTLSLEFGLVLHFTREEIAQMAGTSTETAIRFVSNLRSQGIVRTGRGTIAILDQNKLASMLQPSL